MLTRTKRAVVLLTMCDGEGNKLKEGVGFLIAANDQSAAASNLIVTTYGLIEHASSAAAKFQDGSESKILGCRRLVANHDIAILEVMDVPKECAPLALAEPSIPKQGDAVTIVQNAEGSGLSIRLGRGTIREAKTISLHNAHFKQSIDLSVRLSNDHLLLWSVGIAGATLSGSPILTGSGAVLGFTASGDLGVRGFAHHVTHVYQALSSLDPKATPLESLPAQTEGANFLRSLSPQLIGIYKDYQDKKHGYFKQLFEALENEEELRAVLQQTNWLKETLAQLLTVAKANPQSIQEMQSMLLTLAIAKDCRWVLSSRLDKAFDESASILEEKYANEAAICNGLLFVGDSSARTLRFLRAIDAKTKNQEVEACCRLLCAVALSEDARKARWSHTDITNLFDDLERNHANVKIGNVRLQPIAARARFALGL